MVEGNQPPPEDDRPAKIMANERMADEMVVRPLVGVIIDGRGAVIHMRWRFCGQRGEMRWPTRGDGWWPSRNTAGESEHAGGAAGQK